MIALRIARRYARALADYTFPRQEHETVREELHALAEVFRQTPLLCDVFANPIISRVQKERVLQTLIERANLGRTTATFLHLLLKNYRLQHLEAIARAFAEEVDRRLGILNVEVRTARPLREEERQDLYRQLERLTGKVIRAQEVVDERLLGGVQARLDSEVYDGSLASRLEALRRQLLL
ncbi:MAG: ATP synthase F1 subunit delta [Blastocatellia bacterium]|nr:ATP synthase F1 subunit delta [Blastocatellia bacterium]MCS7157762.1 ATP synthase F1 subunit delta [Blastocatellia bacterium]MCX7753274.1 ATP synthase F1 subunit delta [Blastocatellia bacterium]MDW8168163.1 ATP synthase F1 subunit delta [Acidobacteriota bacterium]MDW8257574.1 ATP synthase F1 subunit delta [Acidobacteriota bacterium]